jgi:hypothetical protein
MLTEASFAAPICAVVESGGGAVVKSTRPICQNLIFFCFLCDLLCGGAMVILVAGGLCVGMQWVPIWWLNVGIFLFLIHTVRWSAVAVTVTIDGGGRGSR